MKSAYWVINRILAKWNKIEYNRKEWGKEKIAEWVRGLCAYVGDLVCICVQWVNMSPFPYSGSLLKWVHIAEGQLKNCNGAGRASEMHAVSMRPAAEGSEPVGNQQTSLELCMKPPSFLASPGPSAMWLDTQSTTLPPGDPQGWPYGGDLCYWDNTVGTKLVYPNNIRVFLLGTGSKAMTDAFWCPGGMALITLLITSAPCSLEAQGMQENTLSTSYLTWFEPLLPSLEILWLWAKHSSSLGHNHFISWCGLMITSS